MLKCRQILESNDYLNRTKNSIMEIKKDSRIGHKLALLLFVTSLVTLVLIYISPQWLGELLDFLYGIIGVLILVNIIYLGRLVFKIMKSKGDRKKLYNTCMVMLINVPFLLSFMFVAFIIKSNLRITFTNETGVALTNIKMTGCEDFTIPSLAKGQSKTIWVDVNKDCSVSIIYEKEGALIEEKVVGYATPGFGERVKYTLGGQK